MYIRKIFGIFVLVLKKKLCLNYRKKKERKYIIYYDDMTLI